MSPQVLFWSIGLVNYSWIMSICTGFTEAHMYLHVLERLRQASVRFLANQEIYWQLFYKYNDMGLRFLWIFPNTNAASLCILLPFSVWAMLCKFSFPIHTSSDKPNPFKNFTIYSLLYTLHFLLLVDNLTFEVSIHLNLEKTSYLASFISSSSYHKLKYERK